MIDFEEGKMDAEELMKWCRLYTSSMLDDGLMSQHQVDEIEAFVSMEIDNKQKIENIVNKIASLIGMQLANG